MEETSGGSFSILYIGVMWQAVAPVIRDTMASVRMGRMSLALVCALAVQLVQGSLTVELAHSGQMRAARALAEPACVVRMCGL